MTIEGRPRHSIPPTAEQQDRWREEAEASRRAREEAAERSAPVRRRLLEAGPPLRDVDAALACLDSCHPRVDVTDRHEGGTTCTCQLSEAEQAEQAEQRQQFWDTLRSIRVDTGWRDQRAEADRLAAELGVQIDDIGGLAPFQITGTVDGRSFYLRARHESFALVLAPEDDPSLFARKDSGWGVGELEIATGDEDELGPRWADALAFCVQRIRDYLRQQQCTHLTANESGTTRFHFCPLCGARTGADRLL